MSSTLATSIRCTDIHTLSSFNVADDESDAEVRPLLPNSFTALTLGVHLILALATKAIPDVPPLILQLSIKAFCAPISGGLSLSSVV